jgi:cytochrome c oxidase subunit 3
MDAAIAGHGQAGAGRLADEAKVRLGMRLYVLTDVIFVAFLFLSYIWLRANNVDDLWFPQGTKVPDANPQYILLGLIVLSAVSYFVAYLGVRAGNQMLLRIGLLAALLLVIATLVGQIMFMGHLPILTTSGSFASTFIALSGYHVYHLIVAVFLGLGVTHRAFRGRYSADHTLGVVTVGYFWYWAALMPVLMTLLLLVMPPQI